MPLARQPLSSVRESSRPIARSCRAGAASLRLEAMPSELPLRCGCGRVRGTAHTVSPRDGLHLLCYCHDCRAFARFLGKADILDAAGGTDIFQMPPARLRFDAGSDALRCMRLSEKGILRWYTDCCRTPIGNTVGPRVPIIGVINSIMGDAVDGR